MAFTFGLCHVICFLSFLWICTNDEHNHKYSEGDQVVLWFQNAYPQNNLLETYSYFFFPFCRGPSLKVDHIHPGFLDAIQGMALEHSGLSIKFKENIARTRYCSTKIDSRSELLLGHAVSQDFTFDVYVDGLKAIGSIGVQESPQTFVYTHLVVKLYHNGPQIVKFELAQGSPQAFVEGSTVDFSYEVMWESSKVSFHDRYDVYFDNSRVSFMVRKFSLINSLIMMVFIMAFACWILLRTLKLDILRYNGIKLLQEDFGIGDEYGWKLVHADVFRRPPCLILLSTLVGTGMQLFLTLLFTISLAMVFELLYERSRILVFGVFTYVAVSPISAFISSTIYKKYGGERWMVQLLSHVFGFPSLLLLFTFVVTGLAKYYGITRYLDLLTLTYMLILFFVAIFPLSAFGNFIARFLMSSGNFPCHVSDIPGPIPRKKWYLRTTPISMLCGLLPFGSIIIEMYFVLTTFWATKVFVVFQFMVAILLVMVVVSASATVISTYMYLNAEDYRWHWMTQFGGLSVSFYLVIYSINYHLFRTKMSGTFQLTFYYLYSFLIALAIGTMCGAFNFLSASYFVGKLYKIVKSD